MERMEFLKFGWLIRKFTIIDQKGLNLIKQPLEMVMVIFKNLQFHCLQVI